MGTCQVKYFRCTCQEGRFGCQCGSENTIILEEQSREIRRRRITNQDQIINKNSDKFRRSNRFDNQKNRSESPVQSNSSDSQNKTKFSTYHKATNKSPNSIERYLMSQECNILTDNSQQQDNNGKLKIRDQSYKIGQIYFKQENCDFQFQEVIEQLQNNNNNKIESPHFQNSKINLENKQSLDQIQSIKDPSTSMKTPTTTILEVSNNQIMSNPLLNQNPSISRQSSPTKISHPITQISIGPISNKQSLSVITDQQQLKNRSRTADLFDDQKSITIRSVLKKKQKNNDSFRTQQQQSRKVRFDLPNSHYIRERQRQQPRLYQ